jgi:hypothetical protein
VTHIVITLKRLRAYATLIAIGLWTVFAIDFATAGPMDRMGKVKGTDFLHFYVIGSLAREGRWGQLYDARAQYVRAHAIAPASRDVVFVPVESPQLALWFAPLTVFGYTTALALWLAFGALLYAVCCALLWHDARALRGHPYVVAAMCVAFPGFLGAVLHGQTAWLSLACVVIALGLLRRGRHFAAGVALGLLVFKPHWAVAAGVLFVCAGEWDVVMGIAGAAAAELTLTYARVGAAVMLAYARVLRELPKTAVLLEPRPGDSLRGYFQAIVPSAPAALALYAAAALVTIIMTVRIWRSRLPIDLRLASIVIALILVNPHVNSYDLLLLAPVCVLLANWTVGGLSSSCGDDEPGPPSPLRGYGEAGANRCGIHTMPWLLAPLYIAPILAALPDAVRLQFSVGAMIAVLLLVGYLLRRRIWFWMPWNAGDTSAAVGAKKYCPSS